MALAAHPTHPQPRVPGQPDMWFFILFEAFLFTSYFIVYMVCRVQDPATFLQSQQLLSLPIGVFNTLILLVSSWSMARCVQASRDHHYPAALNGAYLTIAFGLCFAALKVLEWTLEFDKGIGITTNEYFSFYFFLTGMHFLHLLIGFIFLGIVVAQLQRGHQRSQTLVETSATYWHMVDFLWINIFALLYVVR